VTTVTRDKAAKTVTKQVNSYSPKTHHLTARETAVGTATSTLVTWEEADKSGVLQVVAQVDAGLDGFDREIAHAPVTGSAVACTQAQNAHLQERAQHALNVGLACMDHYQNFDNSIDALLVEIARDINFTCSSSKKCSAHLDPNSYTDPTTPINISVDIECFLKKGELEQSAILWHEISHSFFGPHVGKGTARYNEMDRVEACEDLCFHTNSTKCSCARCLGTTKCDKRCNIFEDCDPALAFMCPCPKGPNAYKLFSTCSQCLVTCPSGLACFGYATCDVVSVACGKKLTCP